MRVVTNQPVIDRNKRIAQILFFASIALLVGSFFLTLQADFDEQTAFYFQCFTIPLLFTLVLVSVRMTNSWVRIPLPWEAMEEGLKGTGGDTVMYNFLLPANHVIVSPNGIFAIVTRFQDSPQKVVDDKWSSPRGLLTLMRQEQIGNPTRDAKAAALQTQVFLQELLGDESIEVQPLIVFVNPYAKVATEGELSVPVLFASSEKKKESLKQFLRDVKSEEYPTLSREQIAQLDDLLLYEDE
jgi:hypothetical protein